MPMLERAQIAERVEEMMLPAAEDTDHDSDMGDENDPIAELMRDLPRAPMFGFFGGGSGLP